MNFLVDAHLPPRLSVWLASLGHDSIHTLDLPARNSTGDEEINTISATQNRVVISKDADFFYSHLLRGRPWKLLLVRTGNLSARELTAIFQSHFPIIEAALQTHSLVEIDRFKVMARF